MRIVAVILFAFVFAFAHPHAQMANSTDKTSKIPVISVVDAAGHPAELREADPKLDGDGSTEKAHCLSDCVFAALYDQLEALSARTALAEWGDPFQLSLHIERQPRPPNSA